MLSARAAADSQPAEVVASLVMIVVGLMLVGSSRDLVMMFLALELISIPTYVLLSIGRRDPTAQEASTKYLLLSVLSSAILLYGFSFLYGVGGSTALEAISARLAQQPVDGGSLRPLAALAMVLIFAGVGFRIAAVPFHFYAPDVYQGTNQTNAALLSVFPKVAGLAVLVRIVALAMPGLESYGWGMSLILAMLTMTVANVVALWQDNLRRLMAYSSIAHAGYMLIGVTVAFAAAVGPSRCKGSTASVPRCSM